MTNIKKGFRDNYLAPFLTLLLLAISVAGNAQVKQKYPQYGAAFKRIVGDSAFQLPKAIVGVKDGNAGLDTAQLRYDKADSSVKVYTGYQWMTIGPGGGSTDLTGVRDTLTLKWDRKGNASVNPATDFFGTTDNSDVRFRINNNYFGRFSKIGTTVYLDSLYPGSIYLGLEAGKKDTTTDASIIRPSIGLGNYSLRNYAGASTGGGMIAIGHMALMNWIGDSTTGSGIAIGTRSQARNIKGFRNVSVGVNTLHNLTRGVRNSAYGFASGEWTSTGSDNSFYGESSARLNTIGNFNAAFGNSAAYYNTGSVRFISITDGGSGYSSAPSVTISAPDVTPYGFTPSIQATGTAVLDGDTVIGVTITEIGVGYSSATVSFSGGGGTGATATATVVGATSNAAFGSTALYSNRTGYGNVGVGVQTGYGDGTNANDRRAIDSFNTFIGTYATARAANPLSTPINKSTAIGYKAIVSQSNSMVLGATGADQPNVGIGTTAPDRMLDVNGNAIVRQTLTASAQAQLEAGFKSSGVGEVNTAATSFPAINSLLDNAALKVGTNGSSDAGISIYRGKASNFGGASITTYRTNNDNLLTKTALVSSQSLFQVTNYGVAGDNSTVSAGGLYRIRAFGTPKTTYVPAFHEWQLRDTSGGFLTKFLIRPHVAIFGDNVEATADDPSVQFRIESTSKGILIPRLNTTQQNAISSPATSLLIFNTDSAKYRFYNGSAWETIGGSSAGGSSYTFANGLTNSSGTVKLGGALTGSTSITGAYQFKVETDSVYLGIPGCVDCYFQIDATGETQIGALNTVRVNSPTVRFPGITNSTSQDRLAGFENSSKAIGTITIGSGLTLASGQLSANGTGLTPTSRTISTTSPLAGGGDMSADRTLSIANAAADGSTKGAASFTANDFNATTGNISIDYTNGQKATGSQPGFMTAAQAARLDSNSYIYGSQGVDVIKDNDSTTQVRIKAFQIWDSDTATTTNNTITTVTTITCPNDGAGVLTVTMVGVKTDGTKYLTGEKKIQWTAAAGAVTIRYTTEIAADFLTGFSTATWTVDASGGTLRIRVTGEATENVEWSPSFTMKYHSVAL